MGITIRTVRPGDERVLAHIQTESWKAAFSHILDPETLQRLTVPEKAEEMYRGILESGMGNGHILEIDGVPHCIAFWDRSRSENMDGWAELICIHSLPGNWAKGYGSAMMTHILEHIRDSSYEKVMLWVFRNNTRAIRFYEKFGFRDSGISQNAFGSTECMYIMQFT